MTTDTERPFTGFGPRLIEFFERLAADNSKAFWHDHKAIYDEQIGGPAMALAAALSDEFGTVKVFRPYRDLRFSKDKSPYKTNIAMAREGAGVGVLYFAIAPDVVDLAGGIYMPSREELRRFRDLQDDAEAVTSMDTVLAKLDKQGLSVMEEGALATAPRGWDIHHPRIELLRLKHIAVGQDRAPGPWLQTRGCLGQVADAWRAVEQWNAWLSANVGTCVDTTENARPRRTASG